MSSYKKMSNQEMKSFIDRIGRSELYEEIEDLKNKSYGLIRSNNPHPYPHYLKAIRVSLVEQGYDPEWVEGDFREALEVKYL